MATSIATAAGKSPGAKVHLLSEQNGRKTYVIAFRPDDDAVAGLNEFARDHKVSCAHFAAIGAFSRATLAWYDFAGKTYREIRVDEPVEVVSCIGDVALDQDDVPIVHMHCAVSNHTGKVTGGHLLEARVSATLEVFLTQEPALIRKVRDDRIGLNLIT
jgi:predicted DNA-binding protein with PD1-like motif